jgi:hypothetical protein
MSRGYIPQEKEADEDITRKVMVPNNSRKVSVEM